MRLTFELQQVTLTFHIDSPLKLGQTLDMLQRFTRGLDRDSRAVDPTAKSAIFERPLLIHELTDAADTIQLTSSYGAVTLLKYKGQQKRSLHWNSEQRRYTAL
jgi:hypothetical protein